MTSDDDDDVPDDADDDLDAGVAVLGGAAPGPVRWSPPEAGGHDDRVPGKDTASIVISTCPHAPCPGPQDRADQDLRRHVGLHHPLGPGPLAGPHH